MHSRTYSHTMPGDDARADVVEMEPVREHVVPHHRVVITVIVVTARHPTPSRAIT